VRVIPGGRARDWVSRVLHTDWWARRPHPSADEPASRGALPDVTSALIHELRTPLAALSAEVEIALRRDRSPSAYREALTRIAEQARELIELTREFAVLADSAGARMMSSSAADLQQLLSGLASRYDARHASIEVPPSPTAVSGDETMLARALRVLVDQAVRSRTTTNTVRLRIEPPVSGAREDVVTLTIDTPEGELWPQTWQALPDAETDGGPVADGPGSRLQIAATVLRMAGGCISVNGESGGLRLTIDLPRVAPGHARTEAAPPE